MFLSGSEYILVLLKTVSLCITSGLIPFVKAYLLFSSYNHLQDHRTQYYYNWSC